jgi:hypothetical protein
MPEPLGQESSVFVCPVPPEQQPVNEYQQLQDSWFYGWATLGWGEYCRKLGWVGLASGVLAATVAASSFPPSRDLGHFLLSTLMGATLLPVLTLLRLYSAWWYVGDRLSKATIFYEESGWYDGQTWQKPPEMLSRDRLIVSFDIAPIHHRLINSFGVFGAVLLVSGLIWLV